MKDYAKKILMIVSAFFLLAVLFVSGSNYFDRKPAFAGSGVVESKVTINPLMVDISIPPQAKKDKIFIARARITNKGKTSIKDVKAEIFLPSELVLNRSNAIKQIGTLSAWRTKWVLWQVKGVKTGDYHISVLASGKLNGELISAEDSATIKITQPGGRRGFWDWFNEIMVSLDDL